MITLLIKVKHNLSKHLAKLRKGYNEIFGDLPVSSCCTIDYEKEMKKKKNNKEQ